MPQKVEGTRVLTTAWSHSIRGLDVSMGPLHWGGDVSWGCDGSWAHCIGGLMSARTHCFGVVVSAGLTVLGQKRVQCDCSPAHGAGRDEVRERDRRSILSLTGFYFNSTGKTLEVFK